jgi:ribosome-associated heat shock protein Hsp15
MPRNEDSGNGSVRLDKWLWCARFFKTRRLATDAVNNGRIRMDGKRLKPSRMVTAGDVLTVRRGPYTHTITILEVAHSRKPADAAARLYEEHTDSVEIRRQLAQQIRANSNALPQSRGRPTKHDRRALIRFRRQGKQDD